jgi:SlyX protein
MHPTPQPADATPPAIDQRLTDLEIKASYTEDTLDRLNEVIIRQQRQIDSLLRELAELRQQAADAAESPRSLRDELPPHY